MNTLTRKLGALFLISTLAMSSACATTQASAQATSPQDSADSETCVTPHELNQVPALLR